MGRFPSATEARSNAGLEPSCPKRDPEDGLGLDKIGVASSGSERSREKRECGGTSCVKGCEPRCPAGPAGCARRSPRADGLLRREVLEVRESRIQIPVSTKSATLAYQRGQSEIVYAELYLDINGYYGAARTTDVGRPAAQLPSWTQNVSFRFDELRLAESMLTSFPELEAFEDVT